MAIDLPIIDAEFEVIEPAYDPPPKTTWTFWQDDFPNLFGLAGGFVIFYFGKLLLFHHGHH